MRLINADQFEVISWRAQGGREYANGFDDGVDYIAQKINKAQTVRAIPVEWIRKEMEKPQVTSVNPFSFVLDAWLEEQEGKI